jgi:hypothetical protein
MKFLYPFYQSVYSFIEKQIFKKLGFINLSHLFKVSYLIFLFFFNLLYSLQKFLLIFSFLFLHVFYLFAFSKYPDFHVTNKIHLLLNFYKKNLFLIHKKVTLNFLKNFNLLNYYYSMF